MTDIVKRPRSWPYDRDIVDRLREDWDCVLGEEAADEIARLRGEMDALQTHFYIKAKAGAEKDAEIERLRDAAVIARTTEANLHSEIERLREALLECRSLLGDGVLVRDTTQDDSG